MGLLDVSRVKGLGLSTWGGQGLWCLMWFVGTRHLRFLQGGR